MREGLKIQDYWGRISGSHIVNVIRVVRALDIVKVKCIKNEIDDGNHEVLRAAWYVKNIILHEPRYRAT